MKLCTLLEYKLKVKHEIGRGMVVELEVNLIMVGDVSGIKSWENELGL